MIRFSASFSAITVAAFIGTGAAFLTPIAPAAAGADQQITSVSAGKGDRLPVRINAADCASQSWPNQHASCHIDLRRSAGEVRNVRVVSLERPALPLAGVAQTVFARR
jgi:hypothetical protein